MPTNRFPTILLAAGAAVLLLAILLGEHMGDKVLGQVARGDAPLPVAVTPEPLQTSGPFGPDWKRSMTLTSAPDPRFPDPRVPPQPLPTRPVETPAAPVPHTPTPNPNIPIWRQKPFATMSPTALPTEVPTAAPEPVQTSPPR
jgi:hypothetical protein